MDRPRAGLDDALAGRGRAVLLVGEPGIGKGLVRERRPPAQEGGVHPRSQLRGQAHLARDERRCRRTSPTWGSSSPGTSGTGARSGTTSSRARGAREQAKNAAAETASQVVLDVNSSSRKLEDAQALLRVTELNRDATRESLRVTRNRYGQQAALMKDVLAAQTALAQASDQYRQASLAFWEARANFEKALGAGR